MESAQDKERNHEANSDACEDGDASKPEVLIIIDPVGLCKPKGEGAQERVAGLAVLTAAQLAAKDNTEVLQRTPRAGINNEIRMTRRAGPRRQLGNSHVSL